MHRIGGLEKQNETGNVSYDGDNHELMVRLRAEKIQKVAEDIPEQAVAGPQEGDLLVLSWGGTFGACTTAVSRCHAKGLSVAHAHLRYMNPLPRNLGDILRRYKRVLIPELNLGQLRMLIHATYLHETHGYNKVKGKPFEVGELVTKIEEQLAELD